MSTQNILILGSTGSIGTSALSVLEQLSSSSYQVYGLSAHRNVEEVLKQIEQFHPKVVTITDQEAFEKVKDSPTFKQLENRSQAPKLLSGEAGMIEMVHEKEVDLVLSGITGAAGLVPSWEALQAGKKLGLANKESLVMAGELFMRTAEEKKAPIIPVDSEHNAIFQCLQGEKTQQLKQIILTSSGGPFRETPQEEFPHITKEQALKHPTWNMGADITINSATMMNKALEIIEARWLFDLDLSQIQVAVHPQSIIHSMVEFVDGSILAQLSEPDMRIPIQYAITYPERKKASFTRFSFQKFARLEFFEPDEKKFPALRLGKEAAQRGGTSGAVLNAANEEAIHLFLDNQIRFDTIPTLVEKVLQSHPFVAEPQLEEIFDADQWARKEIKKHVATPKL